MKTIKVSEAQGPVLNWIVAKAEGKKPGYEYTVFDPIVFVGDDEYDPSADWAQGGPIIEREDITSGPNMLAAYTESGQEVYRKEGYTARSKTKAYWMTPIRAYGPTPLIAAMRCYVASKLGETAEVPEELL